MDQKEFINKVTEQVRYQKARQGIEQELLSHIEDQKEAFMLNGMDEAEASQRAVQEMGDPVEIGVSLDGVHRPKMEWKMILFVFALSITGILIQYVMMSDLGTDSGGVNIMTQLISVIAGLFIMMLFCFFDYSRFGLYGKTGALALILLIIISFMSGIAINGRKGYISLLGHSLSICQLMSLYIPFFGGILYSYKNQGTKGFIKSIIWMGIPVILIFCSSDYMMASSLLLIMLLQMAFVLKKGWFEKCKKKMAVIVSAIIGTPVLMVFYLSVFGATYQKQRFLSFFSLSGEGNYTTQMTRELVRGSNWLGQGTKGNAHLIPFVSRDYILTYIFSYYGILAAIILLAVLAFFLFKLFRISIHQKNQLGMVIGFGCSLFFAVQIILYVLVNLSVIPYISAFLPLFSYGGTGIITSFALIGILLSIYRYQSVLPTNPVRKKEKELAK